MASGRLGAAAPAADTNTTVYTVPEGKVPTINISIVNRGTESAKVNVYVGPNAVSDEFYIEYQAPIPPNGVLERSAIVCSENEEVIFRSSTANCSIRIHGFEE